MDDIGNDIFPVYSKAMLGIDPMLNDLSRCSFNEILELTRFCQYTEKKDKIYALLSLCHPAEIDVKPDYTKTAEWVFENAATSVCNKTHSLDMLGYSEMNPKRPSGLPSWVPDFSIPKSSRILYAPNSTSTLSQPPQIDKGYLRTQGICISTISNLWPIQLTSGPSRNEITTELARLFDIFFELGRSNVYNLLEKEKEDFVRTIIASRWAETYDNPRPGFPSRTMMDEFLEYVLSDQYNSNTSAQGPRNYIDAAIHMLPGRALFTTSAGYIGLGPQFVEIGDIVVLLVGCRIPLILRPQGGGNYLVVGETYYHGIMDGEPFLGSLSPEYQRILSLRSGYLTFNNLATGKTQVEDPRLGELPPGWSRIEHIEEGYSVFRDDATGLHYYSFLFDPRTFPEELEKRGVKLQDFTLVRLKDIIPGYGSFQLCLNPFTSFVSLQLRITGSSNPCFLASSPKVR